MADSATVAAMQQRIIELEGHLSQTMASHTAAHNDLLVLSQRVGQVEQNAAAAIAAATAATTRTGTGRGPRMVEGKTLLPPVFGRKTGPSWRTWSFQMRNYVAAVCQDPGMKSVLTTVETRKAVVLDSDVAALGMTADIDAQLAQLLASRTEVEALEIVRGAELEPGLEQWRKLAST